MQKIQKPSLNLLQGFFSKGMIPEEIVSSTNYNGCSVKLADIFRLNWIGNATNRSP